MILFMTLSDYITAKYILKDLDFYSGHKFELYTAHLFKLLGYYNIKVTRATRDYGIDVICTSPLGHKVGIQCKHLFKGNDIGYRAVEEVCSGILYYRLDTPIVFTNKYFTKNAIKGAKRCRVQLLNRKWLKNTLQRLVYKYYYLNKMQKIALIDSKRSARMWKNSIIYRLKKKRCEAKGKHLGRNRKVISRNNIKKFASSDKKHKLLIAKKNNVSVGTLYERWFEIR